MRNQQTRAVHWRWPSRTRLLGRGILSQPIAEFPGLRVSRIELQRGFDSAAGIRVLAANGQLRSQVDPCFDPFRCRRDREFEVVNCACRIAAARQ